jgi:eukaryotic-like serine/threonine-protein kinase
MTLTFGRKLGPYEIQSPLGAGGMGEVYRARDTRLDRAVAIKILPAHLSSDPVRKQRFEREAKTISSLNHPHICVLHDVGQQDGIDYLVMECVEGETLAKRLEKGPLPLEQVLKYGMQIADALDKAHRGGVVHRDLKPGNIMLTPTGAKLLDFGLAKETAALSNAATLTATRNSPVTEQGTIVGTFRYMSPEQVEGEELDGRSDIFSFGAVLYEMLTGQRAFEGKSQLSVASAILEKEPPPISSVKPLTPPALDHAIRRALAKEVEKRWQSAADLAGELQWIAEGGSQAGVPAHSAVGRENRERIALAVAAFAVLAALAMASIHFRQPTPEARVIRSTILPPDNGSFVFQRSASPPMVSPDGRNVVFLARVAGTTQLWVRALDSFKPRPLAGTEHAYFTFWSPDGRNIGFFAQGKLKRVPAAGGAALVVCDIEDARGGSWNRQDVIIFAKYPGEVYRVPASGGAPQRVTQLDATRHDTTHRWPYFLPDGNHFLYMASSIGIVSDENVFAVGSLDGKVNRILFHASSPMAYDSGYLLYMVDRTLMARPFDASKVEFSGDAVPIAEGVQFDPIFSNAAFSVSGDGVLLYEAGNDVSEAKREMIDASGKLLGTLGDQAPSRWERVSPDGKRVAYSLIDANSGKADIWIHDIASGNRTRLTVDPVGSEYPAWSRDGEQIAFVSTRSGKYVTYVKPANGMGVEKKVWEAALVGILGDWTLDGNALIVEDRSPASGKSHLLLVPTDGQGHPSTLLEVEGANVYDPRLSADGRWLAYDSDESGKYEVYVSAFPKPAGSLQISLAGGGIPTWRRDGKELYYAAPDGNLMAAELNESNGSLQVASRRALFPLKAGFAAYDAFPDGKKFLVDTITKEDTPTPLSLVSNWAAELKLKK